MAYDGLELKTFLRGAQGSSNIRLNRAALEQNTCLLVVEAQIYTGERGT